MFGVDYFVAIEILLTSYLNLEVDLFRRALQETNLVGQGTLSFGIELAHAS